MILLLKTLIIAAMIIFIIILAIFLTVGYLWITSKIGIDPIIAILIAFILAVSFGIALLV